MVNKRNNKTIETPTPWTPPTLKKKKKGVVVDHKKYADSQLSRQAYLRLMNDVLDNKKFIESAHRIDTAEQWDNVVIRGRVYEERIARQKERQAYLKYRAIAIISSLVVLLAIYGFTH